MIYIGHFQKCLTTIITIGMLKLVHPVFYNAPVGIRFEIGGEEPVYLENSPKKLTANPEYIDTAFKRAQSIYLYLPQEQILKKVSADPEDKETILPLYEHFYNLILNYDREKIESLF